MAGQTYNFHQKAARCHSYLSLSIILSLYLNINRNSALSYLLVTSNGYGSFDLYILFLTFCISLYLFSP